MNGPLVILCLFCNELQLKVGNGAKRSKHKSKLKAQLGRGQAVQTQIETDKIPSAPPPVQEPKFQRIMKSLGWGL
jgi:hypothetical protein